jgi:hypothetical protein
MEHEGSYPCQQQIDTCPYPELDKFSLQASITFLKDLF